MPTACCAACDDECWNQKHAIELRVRGTFADDIFFFICVSTFPVIFRPQAGFFADFQFSHNNLSSTSALIVISLLYVSFLLLGSIFPCDFNKSLFCLFSIMLIVIAGIALEFLRLENGRWFETSIKHRSVDLRDISLFPMFRRGSCGRNCSMIEWFLLLALKGHKSFVESRKSCWEMKSFWVIWASGSTKALDWRQI